jgi:hypothetical protein
LPAQRRNGGQNVGADGDPATYQNNCFTGHVEWRATAAVELLLALQLFSLHGDGLLNLLVRD